MGREVKPECANCVNLTDCLTITVSMLMEHKHCEYWEPTGIAEQSAREDVIRDFGLWALRYVVPHLVQDSAAKSTRRRRHP
jgi:hypothetical protein